MNPNFPLRGASSKQSYSPVVRTGFEDSINKIMLVQPKHTIHESKLRRCVMPMGLAYLGSFLEREGYKVEILDILAEGFDNVTEVGNLVSYGLDDEDVRKRIEAFNPQAVGVSCIFSSQSRNAQAVTELTKALDDNIITLTGGSHPTYVTEDVLKSWAIDYIVMGEGELPTSQLLYALNNGTDIANIGGLSFQENGRAHINHARQQVQNLDSLPFPARHLLNMEIYFEINSPHNSWNEGKRTTPVVTSRGCTAKCTFCTTTNFWAPKYRFRSAENVIAEIEEIKRVYGVDEVQFQDDNVTLIKNRAMQIFNGIKDMNLKWCTPNGVAIWKLDDELLETMAATGCYQLTFAVESGNQHVVDDIIKKPLDLSTVAPLAKKAQDLGISVHGLGICGFPGETLENMQETFDFLVDTGIETASFFCATPLPGSELMNICTENGYISEDYDFERMLFRIGSISTPEFTKEQVTKLVANFQRTFDEETKQAAAKRNAELEDLVDEE